MKVELVRTDEENERYRQLVENNRRRRQQLLEQDQDQPSQPVNQSIVPQVKFNILNLCI